EKRHANAWRFSSFSRTSYTDRKPGVATTSLLVVMTEARLLRQRPATPPEGFFLYRRNVVLNFDSLVTKKSVGATAPIRYLSRQKPNLPCRLTFGVC
ncbi:MAG: hypothetical protein MJZ76_10540, partial [Bacteroidales bacterium]|nr:hypothetical protein [Bacteroidales bacterium]